MGRLSYRIESAVFGFAVLGMMAVVGGYPFEPEGDQESDVKEHIESQGPGYLKLPVRILDRSTHEVFTFDPTRGDLATISFRLTRPAPVRVRVVRRDRPDVLLRTLLDWVPLEHGRHAIRWDGRDASGNLTDNRKVFVAFEGKKPHHSRHEVEKCHDLELTLVSKMSEERPAGIFALAAKLVGDGAYGDELGYTLRVFLDWEPWLEKDFPKGTTEFSLPPVGPLARGEHLVVVNVNDGQDHLGVATIRLLVS